MDWDKPLAAYDGKTGYEVACMGYDMHKSQHRFYQMKKAGRTTTQNSAWRIRRWGWIREKMTFLSMSAVREKPQRRKSAAAAFGCMC